VKQAIEELERNHISYALAGGLVASLYRKDPRATADIDFAILSVDVKKAEATLKALSLNVHFLRKANLEGGPAFAIKRQNTPVFILCGRSEIEEIGVDLILANMPWVNEALERAQSNLINFGKISVPCITVEDLIISKLYSVNNQATRFMDLDDLKSIFESKSELDWGYLNHQIKKFNLVVPEVLKSFIKRIK
jgi:hypothetical protein